MLRKAPYESKLLFTFWLWPLTLAPRPILTVQFASSCWLWMQSKLAKKQTKNKKQTRCHFECELGVTLLLPQLVSRHSRLQGEQLHSWALAATLEGQDRESSFFFFSSLHSRKQHKPSHRVNKTFNKWNSYTSSSHKLTTPPLPPNPLRLHHVYLFKGFQVSHSLVKVSNETSSV